MTFTSSTQVTFSDGSDVDAFLDTSTGVIGTGSTTGEPSEIVSYSLNGNTVTIFEFDPGENHMFYLTPDANLLVGDNAGIEDGGDNHYANLSIAVRADSC